MWFSRSRACNSAAGCALIVSKKALRNGNSGKGFSDLVGTHLLQWPLMRVDFETLPLMECFLPIAKQRRQEVAQDRT